MKINFKHMILAVAAFVSLSTALGFASSAAPVPHGFETDSLSIYLSGRASTLLSEVQHEAAELTSNAQTLGTLGYTITWHSHASYLIEVKKHINTIGVRLAELQRIRPMISGWQQQALEEATGHALQVAASTEAAITRLREDQECTFAPEYRGHLSTIMSSSENLKQSVDKFLEYDKTQQKFQQLQRELEL